jgi:tripeptide aminopeptidase
MNKKRLLKTFIDMARISSPSLQEGAVAWFVKGELKKLGLKVYEDGVGRKIGGEAGNIWGILKGSVKGAPVVLLNAHLDTVSPAKDVRPKIKGGYVVSDGTTVLGADNKAGVAVILEVLRCLKGSKSLHGEVKALFTVSEETGLWGAKGVSKKLLKADMGLTLDGGDVDEIINQAPSQNSIDAEVFGRAAHAGVRPEDGVSAIKAASEAIAKMELGRIDHETTANIGIIKGGVATNIIPEHVMINGEARSHDPVKLSKQTSHMKACLSAACKKHKARLKIKITPAYKSFEIGNDSELLKIAVACAKAAGIKPIVKKTGGGSDANIFNAMGVPTLIIGAGADRVHTRRERLSISHMEKSAELVLEILRRISHEKTKTV